MDDDAIDRTPLEALDEAVRTFVNDQDEFAGAVVTGWTLGFEVTGADRDTGMWWDTQYASGPGTSPAAGLGVAQLATAKMQRDLIADDEDDESGN